MNSSLVVGGNRGIGLELCRQLSDRGDSVIATCRGSAGGLAELDVRTIDQIDVTRPADIDRLKSELSGETLDLLLHSSGILTNESLDDMDFERIEKQFQVNTLGPLRVIHGLLDNMNTGSKIAILTSRMGSIEDNTSGGRYGYRISKAGVNALAMSLTRDLMDREIAVTVLHPGLVATEMTGGEGIPPAQAAAGLIQRIDQLDLGNSGTFWHADGQVLPW